MTNSDPSSRAKFRRRSGRGALVILAALLVASGVLRIGLGVDQALARAPDVVEIQEASQCSETPIALVEALKIRGDAISQQEAALADRLAALALADQAIEMRLASLAAAEAELSETLARADGAAEADLTRLTAVYETMKPKDAAALFAAMAPEFAAGFLGRMRPEAAAAVLSGMAPETAYTISVLLAGRNALVPTE